MLSPLSGYFDDVFVDTLLLEGSGGYTDPDYIIPRDIINQASKDVTAMRADVNAGREIQQNQYMVGKAMDYVYNVMLNRWFQSLSFGDFRLHKEPSEYMKRTWMYETEEGKIEHLSFTSINNVDLDNFGDVEEEDFFDDVGELHIVKKLPKDSKDSASEHWSFLTPSHRVSTLVEIDNILQSNLSNVENKSPDVQQRIKEATAKRILHLATKTDLHDFLEQSTLLNPHEQFLRDTVGARNVGQRTKWVSADLPDETMKFNAWLDGKHRERYTKLFPNSIVQPAIAIKHSKQRMLQAMLRYDPTPNKEFITAKNKSPFLMWLSNVGHHREQGDDVERRLWEDMPDITDVIGTISSARDMLREVKDTNPEAAKMLQVISDPKAIAERIAVEDPDFMNHKTLNRHVKDETVRLALGENATDTTYVRQRLQMVRGEGAKGVKQKDTKFANHSNGGPDNIRVVYPPVKGLDVKDIMLWKYGTESPGWGDFNDLVYDIAYIKPNKEKLEKYKKHIDNLSKNTPPLLVTTATSYKGSKDIGHGTSWCTARDQDFYDDYRFQGGNPYQATYKDMVIQFHIQKHEMRDAYDAEHEVEILSRLQTDKTFKDLWIDFISTPEIERVVKAEANEKEGMWAIVTSPRLMDSLEFVDNIGERLYTEYGGIDYRDHTPNELANKIQYSFGHDIKVIQLFNPDVLTKIVKSRYVLPPIKVAMINQYDIPNVRDIIYDMIKQHPSWINKIHLDKHFDETDAKDILKYGSISNSTNAISSLDYKQMINLMQEEPILRSNIIKHVKGEHPLLVMKPLHTSQLMRIIERQEHKDTNSKHYIKDSVDSKYSVLSKLSKLSEQADEDIDMPNPNREDYLVFFDPLVENIGAFHIHFSTEKGTHKKSDIAWSIDEGNDFNKANQARYQVGVTNYNFHGNMAKQFKTIDHHAVRSEETNFIHVIGVTPKHGSHRQTPQHNVKNLFRPNYAPGDDSLEGNKITGEVAKRVLQELIRHILIDNHAQHDVADLEPNRDITSFIEKYKQAYPKDEILPLLESMAKRNIDIHKNVRHLQTIRSTFDDAVRENGDIVKQFQNRLTEINREGSINAVQFWKKFMQRYGELMYQLFDEKATEYQFAPLMRNPTKEAHDKLIQETNGRYSKFLNEEGKPNFLSLDALIALGTGTGVNYEHLGDLSMGDPQRLPQHSHVEDVLETKGRHSGLAGFRHGDDFFTFLKRNLDAMPDSMKKGPKWIELMRTYVAKSPCVFFPLFKNEKELYNIESLTDSIDVVLDPTGRDRRKFNNVPDALEDSPGYEWDEEGATALLEFIIHSGVKDNSHTLMTQLRNSKILDLVDWSKVKSSITDKSDLLLLLKYHPNLDKEAYYKHMIHSAKSDDYYTLDPEHLQRRNTMAKGDPTYDKFTNIHDETFFKHMIDVFLSQNLPGDPNDYRQLITDKASKITERVTGYTDKAMLIMLRSDGQDITKPIETAKKTMLYIGQAIDLLLDGHYNSKVLFNADLKNTDTRHPNIDSTFGPISKQSYFISKLCKMLIDIKIRAESALIHNKAIPREKKNKMADEVISIFNNITSSKSFPGVTIKTRRDLLNGLRQSLINYEGTKAHQELLWYRYTHSKESKKWPQEAIDQIKHHLQIEDQAQQQSPVVQPKQDSDST